VYRKSNQSNSNSKRERERERLEDSNTKAHSGITSYNSRALPLKPKSVADSRIDYWPTSLRYQSMAGTEDWDSLPDRQPGSCPSDSARAIATCCQTLAHCPPIDCDPVVCTRWWSVTDMQKLRYKRRDIQKLQRRHGAKPLRYGAGDVIIAQHQ
jgi:hypothetical protein